MPKKIISLLLTALVLFSVSLCASAQQIPSRGDLYVAFTEEAKMESNFLNAGGGFTESASELQPGDYILYSIQLRNDHEGLTDWYMKNEVIHSLERAGNSARDGAYTYVLSYVSPSGVTEELYNSALVGGSSDEKDALEGLIEATNGLKDYFFVDRLKPEDRARITLLVELDGETQGNDYQDTLADLQMQFAVELLEDPDPDYRNPRNPDPRHTIVRTGDTANPRGWTALTLVSGGLLGLLALVLALDGLRQRRRGAAE